MAQKNSLLNRNSRYVSGGETEASRTAIEWWERDVIPRAADDQVYVVDRKFEGRLNLIAAMFYGVDNESYWWVIAQFNNILDAHQEVKEGNIIYIPSIERVKAILNGATGGVPSTREVPTTILPIV